MLLIRLVLGYFPEVKDDICICCLSAGNVSHETELTKRRACTSCTANDVQQQSWDKQSRKTTPSPGACKVCVRNVANLGLAPTAAVDAMIETVNLELKRNY